MLKARAGFTLAEVLVALTLTAVIGAALTGVFVTQSRFFDQQERQSFARSVSRSALDIVLTELRMLERSHGIVSASTKHLTIRAPIAMGMACGPAGNTLVVSQLPTDTVILFGAEYSGYLYRMPNGAYVDVPRNGAPIPSAGASSVCTNVRVRSLPPDTGGRVIALSPTSAAPAGASVLVYQQITYEFRNSVLVPGRIALWRTIDSRTPPLQEELVAPFDTSAGFRFFVNDTPTAGDTVPAVLNSITGVQLVLNGLSERSSATRREQVAPLTTSVFFRNR